MSQFTDHNHFYGMTIDVILGLQWGDEGKGKIVDYLAGNYDIVARFQGGPNAGHTLKFDGQKFVLHIIPSGIFREGITNLIGNGVVIDPVVLKKELAGLLEAKVDYKSRLLVSKKAHLILPTHRLLDAASEAAKGKEKIGSTLKGIGPTYMDKTGRNGLRVGDIYTDDFRKKYEQLRNKHTQLLSIYPTIDFDLESLEKQWFESIETLRELPAVDGEYYINEALNSGKKILAEGAQGSMLDIDFGTYPFVTSSNTITAGVCTGLGVAPQRIGEVIGITKAYCTRVGSGAFPTELHDEIGAELARVGQEFGATTGRPRRCGWIDIPALQYTIMINGITQLVITKIDVMNNLKTVKAATAYHLNGESTSTLPFDFNCEDIKPVYTDYEGWKTSINDVTDFDAFPIEAKNYIHALESQLNVPITMISNGPERTKLVLRNATVA